MNLCRPLKQLWALRPPATWTAVFATIVTLNLLFLALVYLFDWLRSLLP